LLIVKVVIVVYRVLLHWDITVPIVGASSSPSVVITLVVHFVFWLCCVIPVRIPASGREVTQKEKDPRTQIGLVAVSR
jgi:hypothetical protein